MEFIWAHRLRVLATMVGRQGGKMGAQLWWGAGVCRLTPRQIKKWGGTRAGNSVCDPSSWAGPPTFTDTPRGEPPSFAFSAGDSERSHHHL